MSAPERADFPDGRAVRIGPTVSDTRGKNPRALRTVTWYGPDGHATHTLTDRPDVAADVYRAAVRVMADEQT